MDVNPKHEIRQTYIVRVRLRAEPDARDPEARWSWLAVEHGYASHTTMKGGAYRFKAIPTAEEVERYSGMPWYCVHDHRFNPEVFRIVETVAEEQVPWPR